VKSSRSNIKFDEGLAASFARIKLCSPLRIWAINMPLGDRSAITPEQHAEVLPKHAEGGAGFVYMPGINYITKEVISDLRKSAIPRESALEIQRSKGQSSIRGLIKRIPRNKICLEQGIKL
jgi:hypothetical protein